MPHLSPMNWIMSIILFWLIMLTISSSFWWSQSSKFQTPNTSKSTLSPMQWKWQ